MELIAVLIGGLLTLIGGAVTQWITYSQSNKKDLIQEQKRAYECAIKIAGVFELEERVNKNEFEQAYTLLKLYGSEKAIKSFFEYMTAPRNTDAEKKKCKTMLLDFEKICREDISLCQR